MLEEFWWPMAKDLGYSIEEFREKFMVNQVDATIVDLIFKLWQKLKKAKRI